MEASCASTEHDSSSSIEASTGLRVRGSDGCAKTARFPVGRERRRRADSLPRWPVYLLRERARPAGRQHAAPRRERRGSPVDHFAGERTRFDGERAVSYVSADFPAFAAEKTSAQPDVWWSHDESGLHVLIDGQVKTYASTRPVRRRRDRREPGSRGQRVGSHQGRRRGEDGGRADRTLHDAGGLPSDDRAGILLCGSARPGLALLTRPTHLSHLERHAGAGRRVGASDPVRGSRRVRLAWDQCRPAARRDFSVKLHTQRDGLSTNWIYSILQSRSGAMWIGSWGAGLNRYEHGRFSTYTVAQGLGSNLITSIHEDRSGRLWVGTTAGICYLENGHFERYEGAGLLAVRMGDSQDRSGRLWFGTETGLVRFAGGQFTRWTRRDGLRTIASRRCSRIALARSGSVRFEGLTRLADNRFTRYGQTRGICRHPRPRHPRRSGRRPLGRDIRQRPLPPGRRTVDTVHPPAGTAR